MVAEVIKMREEEKKGSSQKTKFQRILKKRWVYPALYLISAALVISIVFWFQTASNKNVAEQGKRDNSNDYVADQSSDKDAVEVGKSIENIAMPLKNMDDAVIQKEYYDPDASKEKQQAALVVYENSYHPNRGLDISMKDGKEFEVLAALSGTVSKVQEDSLLGNVIVIEHDNGVHTQYQSVKDIDVKVGDKVKQGQVLATAGTSRLNEEAGTHVHFEIRKDNIPLNPLSYFDKPVSSLEDVTTEEKTEGVQEDEQVNDQEEDANEDESVQKEEDVEKSEKNVDSDAEGASKTEKTEED